MNQKKLRVIRPSQTAYGYNEVWGINIPKDVAIFFKSVYFTINRSGTSIILTSGTKIAYTEEQINDYQFEDCKI